MWYLSSMAGNGSDIYAYFLVMFVLFIILLLAFYVIKFLKKGINKYQRGKYLSIVESIPVSQKGHISIIKVDDKYMLVGVTENNINLMTEVDINPSEVEEYNSKGIAFDKILMKLIKKDGINEE